MGGKPFSLNLLLDGHLPLPAAIDLQLLALPGFLHRLVLSLAGRSGATGSFGQQPLPAHHLRGRGRRRSVGRRVLAALADVLGDALLAVRPAPTGLVVVQADSAEVPAQALQQLIWHLWGPTASARIISTLPYPTRPCPHVESVTCGESNLLKGTECRYAKLLRYAFTMSGHCTKSSR